MLNRDVKKERVNKTISISDTSTKPTTNFIKQAIKNYS
jgi:hypothetical protein